MTEVRHFAASIKDIYTLLAEAGNAIMDIYTAPERHIQIKSDDSPVTSADIVSNVIITKGIQNLFSGIPVLSEEDYIPPYEERKGWKYVWILDPLDGTKGFIHKSGEFTINLGLSLEGTVVAGCIYEPVTQQMYFASKGNGAFHYQDDGDHKRLIVNEINRNTKGLKILSSKFHKDVRTQTFIESFDEPVIIEKGAAMKFVSIARGEADYYPKMSSIMEWDTAPGQIIIEEAGGMLVDAVNSQPLKYNKPDLHNPHFIASGKWTD